MADTTSSHLLKQHSTLSAGSWLVWKKLGDKGWDVLAFYSTQTYFTPGAEVKNALGIFFLFSFSAWFLIILQFQPVADDSAV